jgi:hypothetical protein
LDVIGQPPGLAGLAADRIAGDTPRGACVCVSNLAGRQFRIALLAGGKRLMAGFRIKIRIPGGWARKVSQLKTWAQKRRKKRKIRRK